MPQGRSAPDALVGNERWAVNLTHVVDWRAWHGDYDDADSPLAQRLVIVQKLIGQALDRARPGHLRAISVCAGQGHDLIGALAEHPRREDVSARLVELDEHNVTLARQAAQAAGLDRVESALGDASITDAYASAVPADLILLCGVFGNIGEDDIANTISHLPSLCGTSATAVWTRHRHPPDVTPLIRETFARAGFDELAFEDSPPFGIGANRLRVSPRPFQAGVRLFEFIGYDLLAPEFHAKGHSLST